jgi:SAM-dependent methyltransferase
MSSTPAPAMELEEDRLKRAYARRDRERSRRLYSHFNPAYLHAMQDLEARVLRALARHGFSDLSQRRILDAGCGAGFWMRQFIQWGTAPENMAGVDLIPQRIAEARRLSPAGVRLECRNAADLPFADHSFDLVIASTVFSSILHAETRLRVAAEILRVLNDSGAIVWYDFFRDNPANRDVRGVGKGEIHRLFPGCRFYIERVTLAPPLARPLAGFSRIACRALSAVRILNTHYFGLIARSS